MDKPVIFASMFYHIIIGVPAYHATITLWNPWGIINRIYSQNTEIMTSTADKSYWPFIRAEQLSSVHYLKFFFSVRIRGTCSSTFNECGTQRMQSLSILRTIMVNDNLASVKSLRNFWCCMLYGTHWLNGNWLCILISSLINLPKQTSMSLNKVWRPLWATVSHRII